MPGQKQLQQTRHYVHRLRAGTPAGGHTPPQRSAAGPQTVAGTAHAQICVQICTESAASSLPKIMS